MGVDFNDMVVEVIGLESVLNVIFINDIKMVDNFDGGSV